MINVCWLLAIVPVSASFGAVIAALFGASRDDTVGELKCCDSHISELEKQTSEKG